MPRNISSLSIRPLLFSAGLPATLSTGAYSCGMRRIVFCQFASPQPRATRRPFVCYCFANSSVQFSSSHTVYTLPCPALPTPTGRHGWEPFSTQICSISNGSTTISVFFRLAFVFYTFLHFFLFFKPLMVGFLWVLFAFLVWHVFGFLFWFVGILLPNGNYSLVRMHVG